MVGRLLARLNLAQRNACILGSVVQHLLEIGVCHKVGAGAGGKIPATGQQLHCLGVDLAVAADGVLERVAALGERGRVKDDEIVIAGNDLVCHVGQKLKYVGTNKVHFALKTVVLRIFARHVDGVLRNIHSRDVRSTCDSGVERKGTGMRKAIQHSFALGNCVYGCAIVFLIQEKACFLPTDDVHVVHNAVFGNLGKTRIVALGAQPLKPTGIFLHALLLADGNVVSLVHTVDAFAHVAQDLHKVGNQGVLDALDPQRKCLYYKEIIKSVHGQPGEGVRLPEDQSAAFEIVTLHHAAAVGDGVFQASLPEFSVKGVVCVARENAHADLGRAVVKACTQVAPFCGIYVSDITVRDRLIHCGNLVGKHPYVSAAQHFFTLFGDRNFCKIRKHDFLRLYTDDRYGQYSTKCPDMQEGTKNTWKRLALGRSYGENSGRKIKGNKREK